MKIFIDSDVILDFLLDRKPFSKEITEIFQLSINGKFNISVSPTTITNIHDIIERLENQKSAKSKVKTILKLVKIENLGASAIHRTVASKFKDFEDGVQYFCALEAKQSTIITRNIKDYKESKLGVLSPREFLSSLE